MLQCRGRTPFYFPHKVKWLAPIALVSPGLPVEGEGGAKDEAAPTLFESLRRLSDQRVRTVSPGPGPRRIESTSDRQWTTSYRTLGFHSHLVTVYIRRQCTDVQCGKLNEHDELEVIR